MASTSTLLQVCNRVLLNVNERTLANLSTLPGQQVKNAVQSALSDLSLDSDWPWLYDKVNASSWLGNTAVLPETTQRIKGVSYDTVTGGIIPVAFVARNEFDLRPSSTTTARPTRWTIVSENRVQVNPYPTTTEEQAKVYFHIQKWLQIPSTDNGVFDMPETFIDLVVKKATSIYALSHMEDANLYQAYEVMYQKALIMARTRQQLAPAHGLNMYKGYKAGSYGARSRWW